MRKCVSSCSFHSVLRLDRDTLEPPTRHVFILNEDQTSSGKVLQQAAKTPVTLKFLVAAQLPIGLLPRLWRLTPHTSVPSEDQNLIPRTGKSHLTDKTEMCSPAVQERRGRQALHTHTRVALMLFFERHFVTVREK